MKNSVTIQDIANTLNLSRNTVSKVLNGKSVPLKTRNAVISAAIEMGYKGYKLAATTETSMGEKRFVLLSSRLLMNMDYYVYVLRGLTESLTNYDIELIQFNITTQNSFKKFKNYLSDNKVDGIICIEFFEPDYICELLMLEHAFAFLDFPLVDYPLKGNYDIVLPESQDTIKHFCMQMIREKQCRSFGFVGDYLHCRSFYERFTGMREALFLSNLPVDLQYSILNKDSTPYTTEELMKAVTQLPAIPDCFVAANDSIALNLMESLNRLHIRVPEETKIIGFDNITKSKNAVPPLSSVNVNKTSLGKRITALLLERIANPKQTNQIIYISSRVVLRSTT